MKYNRESAERVATVQRMNVKYNKNSIFELWALVKVSYTHNINYINSLVPANDLYGLNNGMIRFFVAFNIQSSSTALYKDNRPHTKTLNTQHKYASYMYSQKYIKSGHQNIIYTHTFKSN